MASPWPRIKRPQTLRGVARIVTAKVKAAPSNGERGHVGLFNIKVDTTALKLRALKDRKAAMRLISQQIRDAIGPGAFAIREGLEDFMVLAHVRSRRDFRNAAKRVSETLTDSPEADRHNFHAPVTVAGAVLPIAKAKGEQLIHEAEIAQHAIKQGWGVYDPDDEVYKKAKLDLQLISDMSDALRNGQFSVVHQPIILADGSWWGSEALVRWNRPGADPPFIRPDKFIELAEKNGFIGDLGLWVLQEACQTAMAWHSQHGEWSDDLAQLPEGQKMAMLSVNVAAEQFDDPEFADKVLQILDSTGFPPEYLQLELTERARIDLNSPQVKRLVERGIKFSIDDFTTGTANLDYFRSSVKRKKSPIANVKLDRSILGDPNTIQRRGLDRFHLHMVETMTEFVLGLVTKVDVTVEGIEKLSWIPRLAALGCEKFQGFGIAMPGGYGPPPQHAHLVKSKPKATKPRSGSAGPGRGNKTTKRPLPREAAKTRAR